MMSMQEVWVQMIFLFFAKLEVVNELPSRVCFFLVVVLVRFLRTDDGNFRAMVFSDDVCFLVDSCGGAALLRRRGIDVDHP